ncbi:unnamed protein product [Amoebophrya sp. A25]|nr:unnamed protein product [Amoebophrya sp. A25]|eukprot:GSA25T00013514001.1
MIGVLLCSSLTFPLDSPNFLLEKHPLAVDILLRSSYQTNQNKRTDCPSSTYLRWIIHCAVVHQADADDSSCIYWTFDIPPARPPMLTFCRK